MIDFPAFTRTIAALIPNAVVDEERTVRHEGCINVGDLVIRIDPMHSNRVEVRGFTRLGQNVLMHHQIPTLGKMTAAADKAPATIAREIIRKIVEPAQPLLAEVREKLRQHDTARIAAEHFAACIALEVPGIDIVPPRSANETSHEVRIHGDGLYMTGSMNHDGSLYIGRVGSIPQERVIPVLKALAGIA